MEEWRKLKKEQLKEARRTWLGRFYVNWNVKNYGDLSEETNQENRRKGDGYPNNSDLLPLEQGGLQGR